ncbi:MAG: hypothetical protein ACYDDV_07290 [Methanoregula sp.]
MSEYLPFILCGISFTIIIFVAHNIVKFFLINEDDASTKIKNLINSLSLWLIIQYLISGFLIVTGLNFLLAILIPISQTFPISLTIQADTVPFVIIGGLIMVIYPIYEIFIKEFKKFKILSLKEKRKQLQSFCLDYLRYKENTGNPKLLIKNFNKDGNILVSTGDEKNYFTKNLKFSLQFYEKIEMEGQISDIETLEIADCSFLKSGGKFSYFIVSNWIKYTQYQEQIQNLKSNRDLTNLKPFIKLKENEIAEKFCLPEMDSYITTDEKFKSIIEVEYDA